MSALPRDGANRWIEPLFALGIAVGLANAMRLLITGSYLPQPFFYQPSDAWMDWFNPAFWAHNPGAYDTWQSLYPPVSFVFLKLATWGPCYTFNEQYGSRDCDVYGAITLHAWYVLNVFLIGKTLLKVDRSTALWRSFAVAAGMPMLYALDRGNLIMVCFTAFLLGVGPLLRSARLRWLLFGFAPNFKIYLIVVLPALLIRRRWRWFEGAALATLLVYLVSYAIIGSGTPGQILYNISDWTAGTTRGANTYLDFWYSTTYQPIIVTLRESIFSSEVVLGSRRTDFFSVLLPILVEGTALMILLALAASWLRPEVVPTFRLINLCGLFAMIHSEGGGYIQTFILMMTFFERWRGAGPKIAIVCCYVLAIPGDIYIDPALQATDLGFLNRGPISLTYWITYGPFVRPAVVLAVAASLGASTVADVWRDLRAQGWRTRARFRYDLPVLLGGGRRLREDEVVAAAPVTAYGDAGDRYWPVGSTLAMRQAMRRRDTWIMLAICLVTILLILAALRGAGAFTPPTG